MKRTLLILLLGMALWSCTENQQDKDDQSMVEYLKFANDSLRNSITQNKEEMRLEVNMIVYDAKEAAAYYASVLKAEIISQTDNEQGMNETMMKLGGVEVRVLDENKDMGMIAPAQVGGQSIGINLFVQDIDAFVSNAVSQGCTILSPVTEFPEIPAKNAVFSDKFNHLWVVNQQY